MAVDLSKIVSGDQLIKEITAVEAKQAAARKYINNIDDPKKKAGAQAKLDQYDADREALYQYAAGGNLPGFYQDGKELTTDNPYVAPTPAPETTGNVAVDSASLLANILNSPQYTEAIKGFYLSEWLPGITQSTYEINAARAQEIKDAQARQQAQADAIRQVAGNYAARGLRTPEMIRRGFEPVQAATAEAKDAAEQNIASMQNVQDVTYGAEAGSLDLAGKSSAEIQQILEEKFGGTFVDNPAAYGSVGANARRTALSQLQSLPTTYGLTQVEQASSAPLASQATATAPTEQPAAAANPYAGLSAAQLQAKIAAANKYISNQAAKGNTATVTGGTAKLNQYQEALKAALGGK